MHSFCCCLRLPFWLEVSILFRCLTKLRGSQIVAGFKQARARRDINRSWLFKTRHNQESRIQLQRITTKSLHPLKLRIDPSYRESHTKEACVHLRQPQTVLAAAPDLPAPHRRAFNLLTILQRRSRHRHILYFTQIGITRFRSSNSSQ
jgi:hypothetical protein